MAICLSIINSKHQALLFGIDNKSNSETLQLVAIDKLVDNLIIWLLVK